MLTSLLKRTFCAVLLMTFFCASFAQNIRPYTQVFSQNLKGGTAIFGNTSMNIVDNSVPNTTKMNESGNASNGQGGIGFSQYGNDQENMQPAMIDAAVAPLTLFANGATWKYNNPNSDQGTAWRTLVSPPAANWISAAASFGYGLAETTTIPQGNPTNYYLKNVTVTTPSLYTKFDFSLSYKDGAIVYVNGTEVYRTASMPAGTVTYSTLAATNTTNYNEAFSIPSSYFVAGNNVIAVEVHQKVASNAKSYFDLALTATSFVPGNATSADLSLPAGTNTIKFARLYWGGRVDNTVAAVTDTLRKIMLRKGASGPYSAFTAASTSNDQFAISTTDILYQSYVDITSFIQTNGNGTYTVANVPVTAGAITGGGHYGGWCIIIAYENLTLPYNSVRLYDGFAQVYDAGVAVTQTVTLTGLNVPNNALVASDAVLSTMVWEGDANLGASIFSPQGDYLKINSTAASNAVNPVTNFWNGTVSKNGAFVTTKNPNYTNQMGIDIDELQVGSGYGIAPNATSVTFEFGTEADQYFPSLFGFSIRMKDPTITLSKTVEDASGDGVLQANEVLTYTLSGSNAGPGAAYGTYVVDSLPTNTTYVANSLKINSAPGVTTAAQTDAQDGDFAFKAVNGTRSYVKFFFGTGCTSTAGGTMGAGTSYSLQLKVKAAAIPGSVTNTATIMSTSQAGAAFNDDATALIAPAAGPVSVKLLLFAAELKNKTDGLLTWTTENELNNHQFDIERSEDGIHFEYRGTVAGSGTTATEHNYNYTDRIAVTGPVVYYRLKIVDLSGKFAYSKIIALRLEGSPKSFSASPNPFDDNITVYLFMANDANAQFRMFSFDGKEVMNRTIALQKGDNITVLKDLKNIMSGSYILEVNTGTEKLVQKIIKK